MDKNLKLLQSLEAEKIKQIFVVNMMKDFQKEQKTLATFYVSMKPGPSQSIRLLSRLFCT